jgi:hypothetical protein
MPVSLRQGSRQLHYLKPKHVCARALSIFLCAEAAGAAKITKVIAEDQA